MDRSTTARRLWGLRGATLTVDTGLMMVGGNETVTIPLPSFVIEHERGVVLFDTGVDPAGADDPKAVYGDFAKQIQLAYPKGQTLEAELALAGFRLEDVTHVVASHTHLDHTGGLYLFPHAKLYAGADDLRYCFWPDTLGAESFRAHDIERTRGYDWHPVHGDLDLFGDGSIVLLHLPGHTPGNLSLMVRLPGQTMLLSGDTVHLRAAYDNVLPMPTDHSSYDAKRSIERLTHLQESQQATLWIGHDVDDEKQFAFAPQFHA